MTTHDSSSAHRRLLDMLAGWSTFADGAVGVDDTTLARYRAEAAAAAELYQEAGRADLTDDEVETFVRDRVVPLLRKGAP